jgi:hypothetical protein
MKIKDKEKLARIFANKASDIGRSVSRYGGETMGSKISDIIKLEVANAFMSVANDILTWED